jgi:hypothetical protein
VTPRVLLTLTGFPSRLVPSVASGGWDPALAPAQIHVRVDPTGSVWVTDGQTVWGTSRLDITDGVLRDFAVGDGYGLLYPDRLQWSSGWIRNGDFGKVLTDGRRLYVSERHGPAVFELDSSTGHLLRTLLRSPDAGPPFLAGGQICSVFTDFDAGVRGIETMTPDGVVTRTPSAHYGSLIPTIGFDSNLRGYAVNAGSITRFSRSGALEQCGQVPPDLPAAAFYVDADGRVLYATATSEGATVFALSAHEQGALRSE